MRLKSELEIDRSTWTIDKSIIEDQIKDDMIWDIGKTIKQHFPMESERVQDDTYKYTMDIAVFNGWEIRLFVRAIAKTMPYIKDKDEKLINYLHDIINHLRS